ncbi:hypothetical protein [Anatilimnocola floriformis]|uniref:hypothetical protein n=1 Tax=Anatilimnocola floriformis TaxID=2948575 RepID=UPI0020C38C0F|nr:hypothetical protein [Anatilimnocola floriformis]
MKRRSGISLVELVVVMSGCAVLLSLSAALLQRVMQAQVRSRADADLQRTLLRLDQSVRNDVHTASAAETDPAKLMAGAVLRLELPDSTAIEYRRQEAGLQRVQLSGQEIKSRETFSFPREIEPAVTRPHQRLIVLSIEADDELFVDIPPVYVRIEAALPYERPRAVRNSQEQHDD